jgi:tape measure domain-containing protein
MAESRALVRLRLIGAGLFVKDARRAERALRELDGAGRSSGRGLGRVGAGSSAAQKTFGGIHAAAAGAAGMVARFGNVAAIGLGIAGGAAAKTAFDYNKMIDGQTVAFTTLLGSQKKAAAFMQQIQDLALKSPVLDPRQTGDAARLLMAFGISAKNTLPYVKALGDMSAATGKDIAEVMPRGAKALGQIASKGKLQAEELNQLAESVGISRKAIRKELGMLLHRTDDRRQRLGGLDVLAGLERVLELGDGHVARASAQRSFGMSMTRSAPAARRAVYSVRTSSRNDVNDPNVEATSEALGHEATSSGAAGSIQPCFQRSVSAKPALCARIGFQARLVGKSPNRARYATPASSICRLDARLPWVVPIAVDRSR